MVSRVGSDGLSVGVEVRGSESESYERVLPERHELTVDQASEDWWKSSEFTVEALGVVRIGAGDEGFGVEGASRHAFQDECGVLLISNATTSDLLSARDVTASSLFFATPPGCVSSRDWIEIEVGEPKAILIRAALRAEGDCALLRLDLRDRASGRGDWRELDAGTICELDRVEQDEWQAGPTLAIPYHAERGVLEVRPLAVGVSAAIDGELLRNPCGQVRLFRGFHSVWQGEEGAQGCDWGAPSRLRWLLWVAHPPTPDDPEDRQQFQAYDWEREVAVNLLPRAWLEPISLEHATRIVEAVYADFFGASATPPRVSAAPDNSDYAGQYDPEEHVILLSPDGMNALVALHETTHAMLRVSAELDAATRYYLAPRHGPVFVARLIRLWTRYSEGLDVDAIRAAAERHSVSVAETSLFRPRGGEAERQAVIEAIRGN